MNKISSYSSIKITVLSFVMMFGIALFHSCGGGGSLYKEIMSDCRVGGVAFFFLVSGFFLVKHYRAENSKFQWWKSIIVSRLKSLLLPYFIWCTLGIFNRDFLSGYGIVTLAPTYDAPLWYVKFLLLFALISPFIVWNIEIAHKSKLWRVLAIGAITLLPLLPLPLKFSFFVSFAMISSGITIGMIGTEKFSAIAKHQGWIFPLTLGFWLLSIWCRQTISPANLKWTLNVLGSYAFVLMFWTGYDVFLQKITIKTWIVDICRVSFFVYCIHEIIGRYITLNIASGSLAAFTKGTVIFIFSTVIAIIMRKIMPKVYGVLTGCR